MGSEEGKEEELKPQYEHLKTIKSVSIQNFLKHVTQVWKVTSLSA